MRCSLFENRGFSLLLLLIISYARASSGLIVLGPADLAKDGRAVNTQYGRHLHYVTNEMGMGYVVDLYEIEPGKSLPVQATSDTYESLYVLEGGGGLITHNGNQNSHPLKHGSFLAFGTHGGYEINTSNNRVKILSVKRAIPTNIPPISGLVIETSLDQTKNGKLDVDWGNGRSRRFLLRKDGLNFSVMDTWVNPDSNSWLEYKNHLESCFCIGGKGTVVDSKGKEHEITPGTIYILNEHDSHFLKGGEGLNLVSVFSPAIVGDERHMLSPDGSSAYRSPSEACESAMTSIGANNQKIKKHP
jgi:L-ectoine synthase